MNQNKLTKYFKSSKDDADKMTTNQTTIDVENVNESSETIIEITTDKYRFILLLPIDFLRKNMVPENEASKHIGLKIFHSYTMLKSKLFLNFSYSK